MALFCLKALYFIYVQVAKILGPHNKRVLQYSSFHSDILCDFGVHPTTFFDCVSNNQDCLFAFFCSIIVSQDCSFCWASLPFYSSVQCCSLALQFAFKQSLRVKSTFACWFLAWYLKLVLVLKKKKKNMGPAISAGSLLIRSVWFTPKLTNAECNLKYLFSTLNLYDTKIVVEGSARWNHYTTSLKNDQRWGMPNCFTKFVSRGHEFVCGENVIFYAHCVCWAYRLSFPCLICFLVQTILGSILRW